MFGQIKVFGIAMVVPVIFTGIIAFGMFTNNVLSLTIGGLVLAFLSFGGIGCLFSEKVRKDALEKKVLALMRFSEHLNYKFIWAMNYIAPVFFLVFALLGFYTRHYVICGVSMFVFAVEATISKEAMPLYGAVKYIDTLTDLIKDKAKEAGVKMPEGWSVDMKTPKDKE